MAAQGDADAQVRALTLGDGNFSFSLAYAERFRRHYVVATSFDSREKLLRKYKEFARIEASLHSRKRRGRVLVLHERRAEERRKQNAIFRQLGYDEDDRG